MRTIVIIGGKAGAKIVQDIFNELYENILFMNNYVPKNELHQLCGAISPLDYRDPRSETILQDRNTDWFVATGDNQMRGGHIKVMTEITMKPPVNAIHPNVIMSPNTRIGNGNLVMPGVIINSGTVIGDGTIINTGAIIEHDNYIDNYAQISPSVTLGGYVTVNEYAMVGIGAIVLPHITIGVRSIVAAGATVIKDVEPNTMVAGLPAIKKKDLR